MSYYTAPFTFDYGSERIQVDASVADVDVIELYAAIRDAQATEEGVLHGQIAAGSGLVDLGGGVQVGITVQLMGGWQLRFAEGAYIARVTSGNLVGGPGGDPISYSAGVQTLLIQSAASTVVNVDGSGSSGAPTPAQNAAAVWSYATRRMTAGALSAEQIMLLEALAKIHGLVAGAPLVVTSTSRTAGDVSQSISEAPGGAVTVERVS